MKKLTWLDKLYIKIGVWAFRKIYKYYGIQMGMCKPMNAIFYNNKKTWGKFVNIIT